MLKQLFSRMEVMKSGCPGNVDGGETSYHDLITDPFGSSTR